MEGEKVIGFDCWIFSTLVLLKKKGSSFDFLKSYFVTFPQDINFDEEKDRNDVEEVQEILSKEGFVPSEKIGEAKSENGESFDPGNMLEFFESLSRRRRIPRSISTLKRPGDSATTTKLCVSPFASHGFICFFREKKPSIRMMSGRSIKIVRPEITCKIFGFGTNRSFQLGLPNRNLTRMFPVLLPMFVNHIIVDIAMGKDHSVILTKRGVYTCGSNKWGECALGKVTGDVEVPTFISTPKNVTVKLVAAGPSSTFVVCTDGLIYASGDNQLGQLGTGVMETTHHCLKRVFQDSGNKFKNIVQIAAGNTLTLFLTATGIVFGTGVIGHTMTTVPSSEGGEKKKPLKIKSQDINMLIPYQLSIRQKVRKVGVSESFSFFLTECNDLLFGQSHVLLGNSNPGRKMSKVEDFECGYRHVLALKRKEHGMELYSFGNNQMGQCGVKVPKEASAGKVKKVSIQKPRLVLRDDTIQSCYAGRMQSYVVTSTTCLVVGDNRNGELFTGKQLVKKKGSFIDVFEFYRYRTMQLLECGPMQKWMKDENILIGEHFTKDGVHKSLGENEMNLLVNTMTALKNYKMDCRERNPFLTEAGIPMLSELVFRDAGDVKGRVMDLVEFLSKYFCIEEDVKKGRFGLRRKFVSYFGQKDFEKNRRNGMGKVYHSRNKVAFWGNFLDDMKNGEGIEYMPNPVVGNWKLGKRMDILAMEENETSKMTLQKMISAQRERGNELKTLHSENRQLKEWNELREFQMRELQIVARNQIREYTSKKTQYEFERSLLGRPVMEYVVEEVVDSTNRIYRACVNGQKKVILRIRDENEPVNPVFYRIEPHANILRCHIYFHSRVDTKQFPDLQQSIAKFVVYEHFDGSVEELVSASEKERKYFSVVGANGDEQFFKFLRDVVSGLREMKKSGFIHRNVNPASVLYVEKNAVVSRFVVSGFDEVFDSKKFGRFNVERSAVAGALGGLEKYRPPEIFGDSETVDFSKYDVYSLGLMCYELYAKQRYPFKKDEETGNFQYSKEGYIPLTEAECNNKAIRDLISKCVNPIASERMNIDTLFKEIEECSEETDV